jgi:hypothetical protein
MLEDLGVTLLIEFSLDDDKGLILAHKPSGLYPIHREHLADDVIEVRDSPVMQGGQTLPLVPCRTPH